MSSSSSPSVPVELGKKDVGPPLGDPTSELQVNNPGFDPGGHTVGSCVDELRQILAKYSLKTGATALKMVASEFGFVTQSQYAMAAVRPTPSVVPSRPVGPRVVRPKEADTAIRTIRLRIAELNKRISEKSKSAGGALSTTDSLLIERAQSFRALKDLQSKSLDSSKGGNPKSTGS